MLALLRSSFARILPLCLLGAGLAGCALEEAPTASASEALVSCGEEDGDIDAEGAFTCDFGLPSDLPLDQVPAIIERDRMYMAERPGMQHKQLPISVDPQTGNLFSGGRYLFDTEKQARNYKAWVEDGFVLDGTKFLERPIFLSPDCHAWSVIGARELGPIDTQVILRTERWSTPAGNQKHALAQRWPAIRDEAAQRGLTAAWLLYDKHERLAELVYFADRIAPPDPNVPDFASLGALAGAPSLGGALGDLPYTKTFDRTQWILTVWFPFVAGDQGEPSLWPHSPPLPQPFCGDGVCQPSRGETGASCAADCPVHCGDAVCQAGENTAVCPSDCRL